jgi:hypothetical protein
VTGEFIRFEFRASKLLAPALSAAHILVAVLLATSLPWNALLLFALLLLGASAAWLLARRRLAVNSAWIELGADGGCREGDTKSGKEGRLRSDTAALSWLMVLRLDLEGRSWPASLLVFPGPMHAEDWRRLQVFLRWGVRLSASAASTPSTAPY